MSARILIHYHIMHTSNTGLSFLSSIFTHTVLKYFLTHSHSYSCGTTNSPTDPTRTCGCWAATPSWWTQTWCWPTTSPSLHLLCQQWANNVDLITPPTTKRQYLPAPVPLLRLPILTTCVSSMQRIMHYSSLLSLHRSKRWRQSAMALPKDTENLDFWPASTSTPAPPSNSCVVVYIIYLFIYICVGD